MNWLLRKITELTETEYTGIYDKLSPSRKAHIDRLKQPEDRKRSLLATEIVRQLAPNATLETDPEGRPYLGDCAYYVSISHSAEAVACAVSESPVGIDIEKIKPVKTALVNYVCLPKEREYVNARETPVVADRETLLRFFEVWTGKEACFKKTGGGMLSIDTLLLDKITAVTEDYFVTVL